MAITSPWIGSSAKAETGKAMMSEAGTELKMSTPFWMSEMKGKTVYSTEGQFEFISYAVNTMIGGANGWSSMPLMDQSFVNQYPVITSEAWKSPRGTLVVPANSNSFPIGSCEFVSCFSYPVPFDLSGTDSLGIKLNFNGTRIDQSKYSSIRFTCLNNNKTFDIPLYDSQGLTSNSPPSSDGYAKPHIGDPKEAALYHGYRVQSYIINGHNAKNATANQRAVLDVGWLMKTTGNHIKFKVQIMPK